MSDFNDFGTAGKKNIMTHNQKKKCGIKIIRKKMCNFYERERKLDITLSVSFYTHKKIKFVKKLRSYLSYHKGENYFFFLENLLLKNVNATRGHFNISNPPLSPRLPLRSPPNAIGFSVTTFQA